LRTTPTWRIYLILAVIVLYCEITTLQATMIGNSVRFIAPSFPQPERTSPGSPHVRPVGGIRTPIGGKLSDLIGKKTVDAAERRHLS